MKRSLIMGAPSAGRGLRVLVTSAMLFAVLAVTNAVISPSAAVAATGAGRGGVEQLFYTTSGAGTGLPNGAEIFAIAVSRATVTTRDVGPTHGGDCGSLALSPHRTLYSMCGPLFGAQQLATINQKTGRAHLFGVRVPGLAVMAMAFGRNGTLYAVGDCNPAPTTFECTPGPATYNSLYKVNKRTGAFTRIGPTGAPQFFMDLTFTTDGTGNTAYACNGGTGALDLHSFSVASTAALTLTPGQAPAVVPGLSVQVTPAIASTYFVNADIWLALNVTATTAACGSFADGLLIGLEDLTAQ
jgi:hypothetical protein